MKVAAELNKAISFPPTFSILKLFVVSFELTEGLDFFFKVVVLSESQNYTFGLESS